MKTSKSQKPLTTDPPCLQCFHSPNPSQSFIATPPASHDISTALVPGSPHSSLPLGSRLMLLSNSPLCKASVFSLLPFPLPSSHSCSLYIFTTNLSSLSGFTVHSCPPCKEKLWKAREGGGTDLCDSRHSGIKCSKYSDTFTEISKTTYPRQKYLSKSGYRHQLKYN